MPQSDRDRSLVEHLATRAICEAIALATGWEEPEECIQISDKEEV